MDGKIALSRKIERNFRLIGWGDIKKGYEKKINWTSANSFKLIYK